MRKVCSILFILVLIFSVTIPVYSSKDSGDIDLKIEFEYFGDERTVRLRCVRQTADGGFISAGFGYSIDADFDGYNFDNFIIKMKKNGMVEWVSYLGGSYLEAVLSIQQTRDGGYILAGNTTSNDRDVSGHHSASFNQDWTGGFGVDDMDCWVVKLDKFGNIVWQKCLGGLSYDYATCIQQTTDGGYVVAANSNSKNDDPTDYVLASDVSGNHDDGSYFMNPIDYWIVKLDDSGDIVWQKCLGGMSNDEAYSIQQTLDGGYIVAGYSSSDDGDVSGNNGGADYWIVRLDDLGDIIWEKSLGGSSDDIAYSIQQTLDGGYIVAGYSSSDDGDVSGNNGGLNYWLVKLDDLGDIIWEKSFGSSNYNVAFSVQQTMDGGYIVAGLTDSYDVNLDIYLALIVKIDGFGNVEWEKYIAGGSFTTDIYSIQQTKDEGYIMVGSVYNPDSPGWGIDACIIKIKNIKKIK